MATAFTSQVSAAESTWPIEPRFSYPNGDVMQVAENTRDVTVDIISQGPSGPIYNDYVITGGADAALFTVDQATGLLRFIEAPDYESPRDRGAGAGNNTYQVEVTRTDSAGTAAQLLTIWVTDVDERPGTAPQVSVIDNREVRVNTVTEADGTQRQVLIAGTARVAGPDTNGASLTSAVPIAVDGSGRVLLRADLPMEAGMTASGSVVPEAAGAVLADVLREVRQHSEAGSASQASLLAGATRFIAEAGNTPLLLQTIAPTVAFGKAPQAYSPLEMVGVETGAGNPLVAVVIDTRGLWNSSVTLDDIGFAALAGEVTVRGGAGNQHVVADADAQTLELGEGNDVVYAGGGDDVIDGGAGNDRLHGEDGDDTITGGVGNDWIDGGAGIDTVRLAGSRADYTIRLEQGHVVVTARDGIEGSDSLANVEILNFGGDGAERSVRGTVTRMIESLEDRVATRVELDGWEAQHAAGMSLLEISATLLEASGADDAMSDDDFVRSLYENGMERGGNLKELYGWLVGLDAGARTRADVLFDFADHFAMLQYMDWYGSSAWIADTDVGMLVRMYDTLFDRAPDQGGLNYWIEASENGISIAAIADTFVNAAEGQFGVMSNAQYVAHLYQAGLDRTASQAEVAGWAALIDDGTLNRGDVLLGIANSAEMAELVGVMSTSIDLL
jgi:Ca2+-binding RTX toxin-like protein